MPVMRGPRSTSRSEAATTYGALSYSIRASRVSSYEVLPKSEASVVLLIAIGDMSMGKSSENDPASCSEQRAATCSARRHNQK